MLYIVPTPIGNLKDITFRAVEVLDNVSLILAEDTRKSRILLGHYRITTKLQAFHKFNEHKKLETVINKLKSGEDIALISDAGTPAISDPGFLLVREAVKNDIKVETLPGASAFVVAVVNSGLPCESFAFEGFLPAKKGRQKKLKELATEKRTIIFYESPYRINKLIDELCEYFGENRQISISRELTKKFEENIRGTLTEVKDILKDKKLKGEFVVVVQGADN